VAQQSNLVNDPTDPIGEPLVQHFEIQRLGIAMGQMLGAFILVCLWPLAPQAQPRERWWFRHLIPQHFAAFGDSESQGVI
jgi:hypothetical protein